MIRLDFTGAALGSSGTYANSRLLVDIYGKWLSVDAIDSANGNSIVKAQFKSGYNISDDASPLTFTVVVDDLASIP